MGFIIILAVVCTGLIVNSALGYMVGTISGFISLCNIIAGWSIITITGSGEIDNVKIQHLCIKISSYVAVIVSFISLVGLLFITNLKEYDLVSSLCSLASSVVYYFIVKRF